MLKKHEMAKNDHPISIPDPIYTENKIAVKPSNPRYWRLCAAALLLLL